MKELGLLTTPHFSLRFGSSKRILSLGVLSLSLGGRVWSLVALLSRALGDVRVTKKKGEVGRKGSSSTFCNWRQLS